MKNFAFGYRDKEEASLQSFISIHLPHLLIPFPKIIHILLDWSKYSWRIGTYLSRTKYTLPRSFVKAIFFRIIKSSVMLSLGRKLYFT